MKINLPNLSFFALLKADVDDLKIDLSAKFGKFAFLVLSL